MKHHLASATLVCLVASGIALVGEVPAQAPRIPRPTIQRTGELRSTAATGAVGTRFARSPVMSQSPEIEGGTNVGWTVLGAVVGFLWYQASTEDTGDGDFLFPFSAALAIGLGAAFGTLLGWMLE